MWAPTRVHGQPLHHYTDKNRGKMIAPELVEFKKESMCKQISFHRSFSRVIVIAQCFGVMPVSGITCPSASCIRWVHHIHAEFSSCMKAQKHPAFLCIVHLIYIEIVSKWYQNCYAYIHTYICRLVHNNFKFTACFLKRQMFNNLLKCKYIYSSRKELFWISAFMPRYDHQYRLYINNTRNSFFC